MNDPSAADAGTNEGAENMRGRHFLVRDKLERTHRPFTFPPSRKSCAWWPPL
jgi:hypothetical protein